MATVAPKRPGEGVEMVGNESRNAGFFHSPKLRLGYRHRISHDLLKVFL